MDDSLKYFSVDRPSRCDAPSFVCCNLLAVCVRIFGSKLGTLLLAVPILFIGSEAFAQTSQLSDAGIPAWIDRGLALLRSHAGLGIGQLLSICVGVLAAYVIFGIAGFGTALVAGPILAQFIPVARIVPLLALLDFAASAVNVARDRKAADVSELKRLVPMMAIGSLGGAAILLFGRPQALLLALGCFAMGYGLYTLSGYKPATKYSSRAAVPFGLVGGVFSALFGSGGFIYAIYLAGRMDASERIRVTQSVLIGLSTLTRALLFLFAGVYAEPEILLLVALLLPAMLAGTALGRRITLSMDRQGFIRLVSIIVLLSGSALVWRYFFA